jgi:hemolysin D
MSGFAVEPTVAATPPRPAHPVVELLRRYRAIFSAAWAMRAQLAGPKLQTEEAAFLPAALSLQLTPVHPAPRRFALAICALFAIALTWACFGRVDIVAVAPGRIVVSDGSKNVQPLETSVVKAIYVKDGDHVTAGQPLIDLDSTDAHADSQRAGSDRTAALSEMLRTRALLAALQGGHAPQLGAIPADPDWKKADDQEAHQQLATEWADITAKTAKLQAEALHRQAEIATVDEQIGKLQATLPMLRRREDDFKALSDQGYVASHETQDRARERVEMEKDLATAQARRIEAEAALREAQTELASYRSETGRTLRERETQAELKSAESTQDQHKSAQHVLFAHLKSPVTGTVQQLAVHTAGGVVTPAQVLLVVIPDHAQVTAEVELENKDVGFVREGQRAAIKLETFPFTRYGTIEAAVTTVAADAVTDDKRPKDPATGQTQAYFPARLTLERGDIDVDGKMIHLTPGMNLTAEIKTGRRRVIDYLISPVKQRLDESAHER